MQITTKGRYAINAMLDLSLEYNNKPITLSVISERQNISLSYLEQLFTKLRRNNLVKSIRGPGGGYMLNKLPEDISIVDIIEAVDENVDLRRCKGASNCNGGKRCISHVLWCDLSSQMRSFLKSINLKELIDKGNK
ncbi:Iron-sulfur cluster regulator IscR [hydrothermal vent metagenome]|uniref:Iron-sulfur cluster regulator IscR n=1 Tax=hydrothermal vent metagenome TaxID=652676 RepID=A0A1W1C4Y0_9ZZZZ